MIHLLPLLGCAPAGDSATEDSATGDSATGDSGSIAGDPRYQCGPYAPQASATLPYPEPSTRAVLEAPGDWSFIVEARGQERFEGLDTWVYHTLNEGLNQAGHLVSNEINSHYLCDEEGLKHHRIDTSGTEFDESGGIVFATATSWQIHDHPLVYPIDMAIGSAWVYESSATVTVDGVATEWSLRRQRSIVAAEEVTVPFGTFDALKLLEHDESEPTAEPDESFYLAEWVGMIGSPDGGGLISFERLDE